MKKLDKEYKELIDEIARLLQENLTTKKELGEVKQMKMNEYQDDCIRTAGNFDDVLDEIKCWTMGISGEAGEVAEYVKKCVWQNHPWNHEKLAYELGDLMYYIAMEAKAIGYTLDEIVTMNIMKRKKRYPNGFDSERSINRRDE